MPDSHPFRRGRSSADSNGRRLPLFLALLVAFSLFMLVHMSMVGHGIFSSVFGSYGQGKSAENANSRQRAGNLELIEVQNEQDQHVIGSKDQPGKRTQSHSDVTGDGLSEPPSGTRIVSSDSLGLISADTIAQQLKQAIQASISENQDDTLSLGNPMGVNGADVTSSLMEGRAVQPPLIGDLHVENSLQQSNSEVAQLNFLADKPADLVGFTVGLDGLIPGIKYELHINVQSIDEHAPTVGTSGSIRALWNGHSRLELLSIDSSSSGWQLLGSLAVERKACKLTLFSSANSTFAALVSGVRVRSLQSESREQDSRASCPLLPVLPDMPTKGKEGASCKKVPEIVRWDSSKENWVSTDACRSVGSAESNPAIAFADPRLNYTQNTLFVHELQEQVDSGLLKSPGNVIAFCGRRKEGQSGYIVPDDRDQIQIASYVTPLPEELKHPSASDSGVPSSIVLFMDSISRNSVPELLPQTWSLIGRYFNGNDDAFEVLDFRGFNALGPGTNKNLAPLFCGKDDPSCNVESDQWAWRHFAKRGFVTAASLGECVSDHNSIVRIMMGEWSSKAKFSQQQLGEFHTAAHTLMDHLYYSETCIANKVLSDSKDWYTAGGSICVSGQPYGAVVLEQGLKYLEAESGPTFLLIGLQDGHEPTQQRIREMDGYLAKFLQDLGSMDRPIRLNIVGDHGLGYGKYYTSSGFAKVHESKPIWLSLISRKAASSPGIKGQIQVARANQDVLVTPYDFYASLVAAAGADPQPPSSAKSLDVFSSYIPVRACSDLLIPDSDCPCEMFDIQWYPKDRIDFNIIGAWAVQMASHGSAELAGNCKEFELHRVSFVSQGLGGKLIVRAEVLPRTGNPFYQVEILEFLIEPKPITVPLLEQSKYKQVLEYNSTIGKSSAAGGFFQEVMAGMTFENGPNQITSTHGLCMRGKTCYILEDVVGIEEDQPCELKIMNGKTKWTSEDFTITKGTGKHWRWWTFDENTPTGRMDAHFQGQVEKQKDWLASLSFVVLSGSSMGILDDSFSLIEFIGLRRDSGTILKGGGIYSDTDELVQYWRPGAAGSSARVDVVDQHGATVRTKAVKLPQDKDQFPSGTVVAFDGISSLVSGVSGAVFRQKVFVNDKLVASAALHVGKASHGLTNSNEVFGMLSDTDMQILSEHYKIRSTRRLSTYAKEEKCFPKNLGPNVCFTACNE